MNSINILRGFKDVEIVGHGKAPVERIANKFRFNILAKINFQDESNKRGFRRKGYKTKMVG